MKPDFDERLNRLESEVRELRDEVCHLQVELDDQDIEESEEYLDHIFESHIPRGLTRNH